MATNQLPVAAPGNQPAPLLTLLQAIDDVYGLNHPCNDAIMAIKEGSLRCIAATEKPTLATFASAMITSMDHLLTAEREVLINAAPEGGATAQALVLVLESCVVAFRKGVSEALSRNAAEHTCRCSLKWAVVLGGVILSVVVSDLLDQL